MKTITKPIAILLVVFSLSPTPVMAHGYPAQVGEKLGSGVFNVITGVIEIPKTMIVAGREKGANYGMTAGFFTGIVHMVGRTLIGAVDVATFFVPTTPMIKPPFIWDDFHKETSYELWEIR